MPTEAPEAPEAPAVPEKKALTELKWTRRGRNRLNLAWRAVKMVVPQCDICQETQQPRWWENCEHNPYIQNVREDVVTRVIQCQVCKRDVPEGTIEHCGMQEFIQTGEVVKPKFRPQPNTREVRIDDSANSGQSFTLARNKGWKLPQDLGIAPMCEFSRCYEPNPKVHTSFGEYCCQEEAKLVALVNDREAVEIFDMRHRQQQLRNVNLG